MVPLSPSGRRKVSSRCTGSCRTQGLDVSQSLLYELRVDALIEERPGRNPLAVPCEGYLPGYCFFISSTLMRVRVAIVSAGFVAEAVGNTLDPRMNKLG